MLKQLLFINLVLHRMNLGNSLLKDVVYVIDKSGSVAESNFNEAINFIYMVTEYLTIGNNAIMVSIVTYSTTYSLEFALDTYSTNTSVLTAINGLIGTTTDGNTHTGEALQYVQTYILQTSNGARTGVDKVVVVLTDGASNGAIDPGTAADSLRSDGVEVFAVGIGTSHLNELQDIANDPASYYVMYVSDFIYLCGLIPALVPKLDSSLTATLLADCKTDPVTTTPWPTVTSTTVTSGILSADTGSKTSIIVGTVLASVVVIAVTIVVTIVVHKVLVNRKRVHVRITFVPGIGFTTQEI
ncbi:collagen alpha-1(XIV) chain-like isoform X1 [Mytilus californianus]|uniref:collagen alpha-1(XIV) chain-like isoform X1 n=1 Tax=Mytilus californianus TaxID=6549 RepID=UPI002248175F|nr:collagen alpha-1(XIV) chain-like isoform X1 [Mytilus californianus]